MWYEFITPAALALIQEFEIPWQLVAFVIGVISLGWLFMGGFAGFVIAAFTLNQPLLKVSLVGIGVAAGAAVVVIAVLGLLNPFHPVPTAIWVIVWVGLAITAVAIAVMIIRRIGRNAKTRAH